MPRLRTRLCLLTPLSFALLRFGPAAAQGAPPGATPPGENVVIHTTKAPPTPAPFKFGEPLCDKAWIKGNEKVVQISKRKDDGRAIAPYNPDNPLATYEEYGGLRMSCHAPDIEILYGRFGNDLAAARRAVDEIMTRKTSLWDRSFRTPFATGLGAYFPYGRPTCKPTPDRDELPLGFWRANPRLGDADWIIQVDNDVLSVRETPCKGNRRQKIIAMVACNGKKNLFADAVTVACDGHDQPIDTCMYPMPGGQLAFVHTTAFEDSNEAWLRVVDYKKRKRTQALEWTNEGNSGDSVVHVEGGGPGTPARIVVESVGDTKTPKKVLVWSNGKFSASAR